MRDLVRSRWAAVGAAVAVTLGAGGVSLTQAAISDGERPVTVTVDTTRILDTRTGLGLGGGRFVDSTPQELQVTGDVPIAPSGTATVVPAGAVGVLVNITVVAPDSKGFLSLRSGGAAGTPATSTVNFEAGITTPNAATVDLSGDGKVQIWLETDDDGGTAHVLLDIVGYTVDHNHDDLYYTEAEVDAAVDAKDDVDADIDGGDMTETLAAGPETLRSVTVQTPTSGYVVANASATVRGNGSAGTAECSITTGTVIEAAATFAARAESNQRQVLAGTRGFRENKAFLGSGSSAYTINFVCREASGSAEVHDAQLTAIFVPDPDAFGPVPLDP